MRVETNDFEIYSDGSQSNSVYGTIYLGNKKYEFRIDDYSRPNAKEKDKRAHREVTHAYIVSGLPYYRGSECFKKYGFSFDCFGCDCCGIDINPGYEDGTSEYEFVGTPEHTIEEVKELVIKAFVESFQFDYDKELEKFKKKLDKRKTQMDEVNEYMEENNLSAEEGMVPESDIWGF